MTRPIFGADASVLIQISPAPKDSPLVKNCTLDGWIDP